MKRPRSSQDFLNSLSFNATSLAVYFEKLEDPELMDAATPPLAAVQASVLELKQLFAGHRDRRASVLNEAEMVVPVSRRPLGDGKDSP